MNSPITFPPPSPTLKLIRPSSEKWAETLTEERRRLQEDHDALREREANLKAYEARLRALQAEIEAGGPGRSSPADFAPLSRGPFKSSSDQAAGAEDPGLAAAWAKLHRTRELLEVEQAHMRDERVTMHEQSKQLKQREEAVAAREARVSEREELIAAASPQPIAGEHTMSAMTRLTTAPFEMARAVFRGRRK